MTWTIALIPELCEEDYKSYAVSQYAPFCQIEKCSHCHSSTEQTLSTLQEKCESLSNSTLIFLFSFYFFSIKKAHMRKHTHTHKVKMKLNLINTKLWLPCQEAAPY